MSFVEHCPHGRISCMAKQALYEALNGDEQFDFESNKGQFLVLSCFNTNSMTLSKGHR